MKILAKFAVYVVIGALLSESGYMWHRDWQWWAWFLAVMFAVDARAWAMRPNK